MPKDKKWVIPGFASQVVHFTLSLAPLGTVDCWSQSRIPAKKQFLVHIWTSQFTFFAQNYGSRTLRPQDTSATRHFGTTKLVPKFNTNHRWSCVSSELSWVEVSWLFLDHVTRVEVSRITFLVSKYKVSWDRCRSVPECLDAEVSCGRSVR